MWLDPVNSSTLSRVLATTTPSGGQTVHVSKCFTREVTCKSTTRSWRPEITSIVEQNILHPFELLSCSQYLKEAYLALGPEII